MLCRNFKNVDNIPKRLLDTKLKKSGVVLGKNNKDFMRYKVSTAASIKTE
jgi:hypothetical protein